MPKEIKEEINEEEDKMLVKKSAVYAYVKEEENGKKRVGADIPNVINEAVLDLIDSAIERVKANQKKTLRPCDF